MRALPHISLLALLLTLSLHATAQPASQPADVTAGVDASDERSLPSLRAELAAAVLKLHARRLQLAEMEGAAKE